MRRTTISRTTISRTTIIGTAASAALIVALSGCGGSTSPDAEPKDNASASSAPAKEPAQAVADAFKKTSETSFKFQMTVDSDAGSGSFDAKSKGIAMTMPVEGVTMEMVMIGTDVYIKGLAPAPNDKKWVHTDRSSDGSQGPAAGDPLGILGLLTAGATVEAVGDGKFKGTFDLTKAVESLNAESKRLAEWVVKSAGDRAKNVPFEATVDSKGYLTQYKIVEPTGTDKTTTTEMKLSDFGADITIAKPAPGETIEMKDLLK